MSQLHVYHSIIISYYIVDYTGSLILIKKSSLGKSMDFSIKSVTQLKTMIVIAGTILHVPYEFHEVNLYVIMVTCYFYASRKSLKTASLLFVHL